MEASKGTDKWSGRKGEIIMRFNKAALNKYRNNLELPLNKDEDIVLDIIMRGLKEEDAEILIVAKNNIVLKDYIGLKISKTFENFYLKLVDDLVLIVK